MVLVVLVAGCVGGEDTATPESPHAVLAATAERMDEIRSADIGLLLVAETRDGSGRVGFRLEGPLGLAESGDLPVADLEYTQIAGDEEGGGRFLSTGEAAYVELDGTMYVLPEERSSRLHGVVDGGGPVSELDIGDWLTEPTLESNGDTRVVAGQLDVAAFYEDLRQLTSGALPELDDEARERLRSAVSDASIEVLSGAEDDLLRRVNIHLVVGPEAPDEVPGLAKGAEVTFELTLDAINEPVEVETPEDAQPLPLPSG